MAYSARVKKVLELSTQLTPEEFEELVTSLLGERRAAAKLHRPGVPRCTGEDLVRLLKSLKPDPDFADDIEAAVREMRAEPVTSPWDR